MKNQLKLTPDKPIDIEKAINLLGGQDRIFYQMLSKLENLSLKPCLHDMAEAVNSADFARMKSKAHGLKGAAGWVCANNI